MPKPGRAAFRGAAAQRANPHVASTLRRAGRLGRGIVLLTCGLLWGGCDHSPFQMVSVEGQITYEDGTVIPAKRFQIWFTSQAPPIDPRTYPRPASAFVDLATGSFRDVTTTRYGDGLVRGKHKVHLDLEPAELVPKEFTVLATSPLSVDTAQSPFQLKVPRPTKR